MQFDGIADLGLPGRSGFEHVQHQAVKERRRQTNLRQIRVSFRA